MLDQAELMQVRKYLIRILPELLVEEPEIATAIEQVLAKKFVRRDELNRLLDQLNAYRKESIQRFDGLESSLEALRLETGHRFDKLETRANDLESHLQAHRIDTRERFERVEVKLHHHGTGLERLEGLSLDAKRRLFKLEAGQERILRRLDQQEQWLKLMVGQLGEESKQPEKTPSS